MSLMKTIRGKLILVFGCVIILSLIVSGIAISAVQEINSKYTSLEEGAQSRGRMTAEMRTTNATIYRMLVEIALSPGNHQLINSRESDVRGLISYMYYLLDRHENSVITDAALPAGNRDNLLRLGAEMRNMINSMQTYTNTLTDFSRNSQFVELSYIMGEFTTFSDSVRVHGESLTDLTLAHIDTVKHEAMTFSNTAQMMLIIASGISAVLSIFFAIFVIRSIRVPIHNMSEKAKQIADGNFSVDMRTNSVDEIGVLSNVIADTIQPFTNLIHNLEKMAEEVNNGMVSSRIDEKEYHGDYKRAVTVINQTINNLAQDNIKALNVVKAYGQGDFNAKLEKLPGERAIANEIVDQLQENLTRVDKEINHLIKAASIGDLSQVLDSSKYEGNWKGLIEGLNSLVKYLVDPLNESAEVLSEVVKGNFSVRVQGDYKNDLVVIKNSLNTTVTNLQSYIQEMNDILGKMANKDLTVKIEREYLGEFVGLRASINEIVDSFNQVVSEINSSSSQIAAGVTQVSESSITLAQGAAEQSSAVETLNSSIEKMTSQIQNSAENAIETSKLALSAKQSADTGNKDMKEMLVSMDEINSASEDISKIIKVIDDIAFQTNLLALNAAVEAARAGEHGKGFAVVAEEVRALAQRSKDAAAETNALIESSRQKTSVGSTIANKTAQALDEIVSQISEISVLIEDVAKASTEQKTAIEQINVGVSQIAVVTQSNTATSEESASVSEELSSQTETFRAMVSEFNLR